MSVILTSAAVAFAGGSIFAQSAAATQGTPPTDATARQIEDMARRLESLEKRNAELQGQVVELNAKAGDQWLTEERAAEVREIVQDVLADTATRTSLQGSGATAGWDNGFFLASADNRFRIEFGGLIQARWMLSAQKAQYVSPPQIDGGASIQWDPVPTRYGFDLQNIELWAQGHVVSPDIQYMVKGIFSQNQDVGTQVGQAQSPIQLNTPLASFMTGSTSGGLQLLDAWVRVNLTDDWSFRMGQFRAPYGREFLVLEQYQMAVDRSLVSLHYGMGYTQGVELEWITNEARWRFAIDDGGTDNIVGPARVVGSQPLNSPWYAQNAQWGITTRFDWKGEGGWKQFDQFTSPEGTEPGWLWGIAFNAQQTDPTKVISLTQGPGATSAYSKNTWLGVTTDLTMQFGGASLFASAYFNHVESNGAYFLTTVNQQNYAEAGDVNALGFVLQASYYLAPKWEVYGRYEYMHTTASNSGDPAIQNLPISNYLFQQHHMDLLTIGANWYIDGQDVKFTADMGWSLTPVYPSYAVPATGWRVSQADEFVLRAQMQLLF
jgi:hypothetical protein